ncbi:MAG: hypothetical protein LUH22_19740, partial [Bacteroides sp.]|nr:hypothetical protein [Bacteroides sp.]
VRFGGECLETYHCERWQGAGCLAYEEKDKDRYYASMCYPMVGYTGMPFSRDTRLDGEYDLFSCLTPSVQAQFIISDRSRIYSGSSRRNLKATFLDQPRQKLDINSNEANYIEGFNLTDDHGFRYSFGGPRPDGRGTLAEFGPDKNRGIDAEPLFDRPQTAWPLTTITSPLNETIQFTYEESYNYTPEYRELRIYDAAQEVRRSTSGDLPYSESTYYTGFAGGDTAGSPRSVTWRITRIESDKEIVRFIRYTFAENSELSGSIKEIQITNKFTNQLCKTIRLNYDLHYPHTLLNSVTVYGSDSRTQGEKYNFSYYLPSEPVLSKHYADQWGFYRERTNGKYFHSEFTSQNYKYVRNSSSNSITASPLSHQAISTLVYDRTYNLSGYNLFSLQEITFPTGGTTRYQYEPHEFNSYALGRFQRVKGGGQRIESIISDPKNGSPAVVTKFKYGTNEDRLGYTNFDLNHKAFMNEIYHVKDEGFHAVDLGVPTIRGGGVTMWTERIFQSSPIGTASQELFCVSYPEVAIYRYEASGNNFLGKVVSTYSIDRRYTADYVAAGCSGTPVDCYSNYAGPYNIIGYNPSFKPQILTRAWYNKNNAKVKSENYVYEFLPLGPDSFDGLKVYQTTFAHGPDGNWWHEIDNYIGSYYQTQLISYYTGTRQLKEKKTTFYDNPSLPVTIDESFHYDDLFRLSQKMMSNNEYFDDSFYHYPSGSSSVEQVMVNKNMLSTVIQETGYRNGYEKDNIRTRYGQDPNQTKNFILPTSVEGYTYNDTKTQITYDLYDNQGNLLQCTTKDGVITTYLWSYKGHYPVAEIKGAAYSTVRTALGGESEVQRISNSTLLSTSDQLKINNLRSNSSLSAALINTYTYQPLAGILTATDPRGITTYYEYDVLNRLKRVYLKENNVEKNIESYEYNYKNQ